MPACARGIGQCARRRRAHIGDRGNRHARGLQIERRLVGGIVRR